MTLYDAKKFQEDVRLAFDACWACRDMSRRAIREAPIGDRLNEEAREEAKKASIMLERMCEWTMLLPSHIQDYRTAEDMRDLLIANLSLMRDRMMESANGRTHSALPDFLFAPAPWDEKGILKQAIIGQHGKEKENEKV